LIALIQRVTQASVSIADNTVAAIGPGALVLIGVRATDTKANAEKLSQRLISYRVFSDENGKMNLDIQQSGGSLLLVPQFTLAADTSSGRRPGRFGADMAVSLVNDGPVTFWLEA